MSTVSLGISRTGTGRAENLWAKAVDALRVEDKAMLDIQQPDKRATLEKLLQTIQEKQELSSERRWKLKKKNGEVVFMRDILGKVAKAVSRFREVGDVAVQYDPSHAALPWAGVRLALLVRCYNMLYAFLCSSYLLSSSRLW